MMTTPIGKEFTGQMQKRKLDDGGQAGTEQSLWSAVGWARLSEAERFKRFNYARDKLGEVMKRWDNFSEPQRAERCERQNKSGRNFLAQS